MSAAETPKPFAQVKPKQLKKPTQSILLPPTTSQPTTSCCQPPTQKRPPLRPLLHCHDSPEPQTVRADPSTPRHVPPRLLQLLVGAPRNPNLTPRRDKECETETGLELTRKRKRLYV
ncbi:hypothetical protein GQ43DRAFT_172572 [Delitschia confertaspora ATCC 74209]|uniref:Uncharacterized protein n=1 Tax=Delitschia confertaspora ATCC 74209 TaxID=1513339 RepID=A0A9P4JRT4_9PLEO|nr:hypothetical protein GQ43DRAFT_172572 [Delitschia confertaspora ATCC 74209]